MSYQVRLYKNTGFNTSNIPDSPGLLDQCQHIDASSGIEYMQDRFLTSVPVQVQSYDVIKDVDYLRVNDFYYFVTGIRMSSTDVANFSLTPDFITSARGITGFTILDGVTNRVHVADDAFGKADSNDPMLAPFEPLEVDTVWKKPSHAGKTYIESTISIEDTCQAHEAVSWTDTITATSAMVLVPKTIGVGTSGNSPTSFTFQNGNSESHGTRVYITDGADSSGQVNEYIGELRSLGLEQSIVNQVRIPNAYVSRSGSGAVVSGLTATTGTWNVSNFPYNVFSNIKNMLINYSAYMKYGIISCSGESAEFEPQDLHTADDVNTHPTIKFITDPHLDGKPYFRFSKVNGDDSNDGFWRNCISGMQWKQVPLVYQGASGSALNQLRFENGRKIAEGAYDLQSKQLAAQYERSVGGTGALTDLGLADDTSWSFSRGFHSLSTLWGAAGKVLQDPLNAPNNFMGSTFSALEQAEQLDYNYGAELKNQLLDIAINANVYVPTVNFPYNSHILQETFENGVLCYRYKYRNADVTRIDKLLTMYGYKFSKPLETTDFTNRQFFNFVECSNVTVSGKPRWWNDGIAAQLKGGIRVWHVLPNPTYYNNNPVA